MHLAIQINAYDETVKTDAKRDLKEVNNQSLSTQVKN